MSLRMWLPLLGDLKNNGCDNLTITNSGATVDNSGKLGKCYSFDGTDDYITTTISIPKNSWSACVWIYPTAYTSGSNRYAFCINGSSSTDFLFSLGLYSNYLAVRVASQTYNASTTCSMNRWYHLCATYDGSKLKFYIDGVLNKTLTNPPSPSATTNLMLGKRAGNAGYFQGRLNDARVYDHILSPAEIKQISQGLVCHYKLDDGNINLLPRACKSHIPTDYCGYQFNLTENLVAGQTYTIQFWDVTIAHSGKTDGQLGLFVYWGGGSVVLTSWSGNTYFTGGHADYLVKTFTVTESQASGNGASNLWLNIYNSVPSASGTRDMQIKAWKLEKGSVATPWRDASNTIIMDSSGYSNNGTVSGSIMSYNDSPRNMSCFNFPTTADMINCGRGGMVTDSITVNLWFNYSTWGNPISCTESGGWNIEKSSSGVQFSIYISGVGYKPANAGIVPSSNAWHMVTGVYDRLNQITKIYIDGELKGTTATTAANVIGYNSTNVIWIAGEATSSATTGSAGMAGKISDVRIYATALSDTDIKNLYETDERVASKKDIHAYEFVEKGGRELLNGTMITSPFNNKTARYTAYTDGEIKLTGQSSVGSKYIDVFPTNKTYYWDAVVTKEASNVFYIGFERYDKDKTSRSNNATIYVVNGNTSAWNHNHVYGTVDLSTDGVNPCRYIALRILNDWGTENGRTATVHSVSLREATTLQTPTIQNNGVFLTDEIKEDSKAAFSKYGFIESTEFKEL